MNTRTITGGHVFPVIITLVPTERQEREDKVLRFFSGNFEDKWSVPIWKSPLWKKEQLTNYPKGVLHLQEAGRVIDSGMDVYVYGNIPNGLSSASLELLISVIAEKLYDLHLDRSDWSRGKQTENYFIGVNSGIMDQFAIGMGSWSTGYLPTP